MPNAHPSQSPGDLPVLAKVAEIARTLSTSHDVPATLGQVLTLAVDFIAGADDAAVSMRAADGSVETPAATSDRGAHVDRLQYENGAGPCLSALRDQELVSVPNLESEQRWGRWGPVTARETGVRSMLCFRLFTDHELVGALNLYAGRAHSFTSDDVDFGWVFAAQAAVHVARAQHDENVQIALASRSRIGEAVGILMERFSLTSDRGFEVLARVSQHSNRKLRDVAAELVETRQLPTDPLSRQG